MFKPGTTPHKLVERTKIILGHVCFSGFVTDLMVERARTFAANAHAYQVRKYTEMPYITHCMEVAVLVERNGGSNLEVAAAWLHDVVEDCGVTYADLVFQFGPRVAKVVMELTDISKPSDGNRAARKAIDLEHLKKASSAAMKVKLADIMSNALSITKHDPKFSKTYIPEKQKQLSVIPRSICPKLWDQANRITQRNLHV